MKANRYYRMKAQHRCTACGKQDDRTAAGKTQCASCAEKSVKANRRYQAEHKGEYRTTQALWSYRRYHQRLENHCCVRCGQELAKDYYYTCCERCRNMSKTRNAKKKTA